LRHEIKITADVVNHVSTEQDSVVGRSLYYLEAKRDSNDLVVFLHGLGLDANDFRPYIAESKLHCIALTLYGFNVEERDDGHYRPISLKSHVQLLGYALARLHQLYPAKRITLVGFSFGADMIFFLAEYAASALRDVGVHKTVLLDPNVNADTTTISSKVAHVSLDRPLDQLVKILESATSDGEFRYLCEYLYKITGKNFARIQKHAEEVVAKWEGQSYERFLNCIGQLVRATSGVHIVFSFNYERIFNAVVYAAVARGLDENTLECSQSDHFELIGPGFLKDQLEGVL
jgi:pimeloyl-ACP methyl ester carboxylesterase